MYLVVDVSGHKFIMICIPTNNRNEKMNIFKLEQTRDLLNELFDSNEDYELQTKLIDAISFLNDELFKVRKSRKST